MLKGKTISGYTLQQEIGVGGMTEMWLAENVAGNKAAVKLLLPKFCHDEAIVARFQNEAKVTVKLKHPNIRQVLDIGQIEDRPCLVMEYLEGDNLETMVKKGRHFTDGELRHWWNQLASALTYTHAQGVAHCDIKPSNIFIDRGGNVKLLDFGIAIVRDSITTLPTGATKGTLMYMSPEQVRDSKHVEWQTDVYSLAVTFVHLLTGKPPYNFDNTDDYEIRKSIVEEPLDMSGVSSDWQEFLRPYLVKSPEERPTLAVFGTVQTTGKMVLPWNAVAQSKRKSKVWLWIMVALLSGGGVMLALLLGMGNHRSDVSENPKRTYEAEDVPSSAEEAEDEEDAEKTEDTEDAEKTIPEKTENRDEIAQPTVKTNKLVPAGYVDLGLSVYWENSNEWNNADDHGFYTYDDAKSKFGSKLPTKSQWEELRSKCTWTWTGSGYNVQGPNGNKIYLPAAGGRNCGDGEVYYIEEYGNYWSSTPNGSGSAWNLIILSKGHGMISYYRCFGYSVRLVQGK